jgi:hypothetical protein
VKATGIPETEYGHIGGGSASEPVGDKKVYIRSCAMVWYHGTIRKPKVESRKSKVESRKSKVESRKSKVESRKSKVESRKKRCYTHFCDVKVDTTLRFPGFYPPIPCNSQQTENLKLYNVR